jgi:Ca2+-binding EF-hand superfamily protein
MNTHLLILSSLIAGAALADPQPNPPARPEAAQPVAKPNPPPPPNGGGNAVVKTRMFINGVEVDPAAAGAAGAGLGGVIHAEAIQVDQAGGMIHIGGPNGHAVQALPIGDMGGFGGMMFGGDDGDFEMGADTRAAIRKNLMAHLKNNPQLPPEARRQILKDALKNGPASAVPPPPVDYLPQYQMDDYSKYVAHDKDGDGFLNEQEAAAYGEALRAEETAKAAWYGKAMLATYDKNHDGKLDDAEKKEYQEFVQLVQEIQKEKAQKQAEFTKQYDQNQDGKLDAAEYTQALKQEEIKRLRQQLLQARPALDLDKNGKFDDAEFAAFEKEMLPKYDANKDGKLDKPEIRKVLGVFTMEHFQQMQQQMQADQQAAEKAKEQRYDIDGDGKLNAAERKRMQDDQKLGAQVPPQDE